MGLNGDCWVEAIGRSRMDGRNQNARRVGKRIVSKME